MKAELEAALCKKYPKIFENNNPNPNEDPFWGFECGDGWYDLIDSLSGCIQHYIDQNPDKEGVTQIKAVQVKEKFSGLRYYIEDGDDQIHSMIRVAESLSFKICESCGNKGQRRSGGWIKTLCDPCEEVRQSKRSFVKND